MECSVQTFTGGQSFLGEPVLPGMARGEVFATVGISHLTTSRQFVDKPVLPPLLARRWIVAFEWL